MPLTTDYFVSDSEPSGSESVAMLRFQHSIADRNPQIFRDSIDSYQTSLSRDKFKNRQRLFVVSQGHAANQNRLGQVIARISPTLTSSDGLPQGMLGFFAAENNSSAVAMLLRSACAWLKNQGCKSIIGPIDGDTWHSYRVNIGPYSEPSFLSEPTNPEYYSHLWVEAGFEVVDSYHSKFIANLQEVLPVTKPAFDKATAAGYRIRSLRMDQFETELDIIYELSIQAFSDNFLYDQISRAEFHSLYAKAKPLVDPELVCFAVDPKSEREIAFLFCIVDYGQAVGSMNGRDNLWAKIKFALHRRAANAVNFKSIGVLPKHRRSSVAAALMHHCYEVSLLKGFRRANLCLIRDGNPSTKLDGGLSKILRRYELYQLND